MVQEGIYDKFVEKATERAKARKVIFFLIVLRISFYYKNVIDMDKLHSLS